MLRQWIPDRQQAEAVYLVVFPSLTLLLVLAQYVVWTWVDPVMEADVTRPATLRFLAAQVLGAATLLLLGVVGFVPAVRVTVQDSRIVLHQGRRSCAVSLDQIRSYVIVAADRYHREYRPYEAIDAYISRMPSEIIMLDTAQAQIAIGLRSTDRLSLAAWMDDTDAAECRRMPVRASVDR